ncbi:MAG: 50S ribosomal protein L9, partial [Verrucomicrobiota bacterium]
TEVLLIKPVDGLGAEGEQVRVRAGYARNFLLPQGVALPVNRANTKYVESLRKAREAREARDLEAANATAAKLAALRLTFAG